MSGIYETDFVFFVVGVYMLKFQFIILFCHEILIIDNGNENVTLCLEPRQDAIRKCQPEQRRSECVQCSGAGWCLSSVKVASIEATVTKPTKAFNAKPTGLKSAVWDRLSPSIPAFSLIKQNRLFVVSMIVQRHRIVRSLSRYMRQALTNLTQLPYRRVCTSYNARNIIYYIRYKGFIKHPPSLKFRTNKINKLPFRYVYMTKLRDFWCMRKLHNVLKNRDQGL